MLERRRAGPVEEYRPVSIQKLRKDAGLSQQDVADALGVSQQAVGKWERENDPGSRWYAFADVVGVREQYPAAPFEHNARRAWFDARNRAIQGCRLRSSYGHGRSSNA